MVSHRSLPTKNVTRIKKLIAEHSRSQRFHNEDALPEFTGDPGMLPFSLFFLHFIYTWLWACHAMCSLTIITHHTVSICTEERFCLLRHFFMLFPLWTGGTVYLLSYIYCMHGCNATKLFKQIHISTVESPVFYVLDPRESPVCIRCISMICNLTHSFWSCSKLYTYWKNIFYCFSEAFGKRYSYSWSN